MRGWRNRMQPDKVREIENEMAQIKKRCILARGGVNAKSLKSK